MSKHIPDSGIYVITNTRTGRQYVGQSHNVTKRVHSHFNGYRYGELGEDIAKLGRAAFKTEILEFCAAEDRKANEIKWIIALDTLAPKGYNLRLGNFLPSAIDRFKN